MPSLKPLLLIDVDGVLNPVGYRNLKSPPEGYILHAAMGFRVLLNKDHGAWLNGLADRFELIWATTWEDDANIHIGPRIGLPRLPVISFDGPSHEGRTWKLPAVKRAVVNRAFAWIDDDLMEDAHEWATDRSAPTLLLDIDPVTGLTMEHIKTLEAFAARLESNA